MSPISKGSPFDASSSSTGVSNRSGGEVSESASNTTWASNAMPSASATRRTSSPSAARTTEAKWPSWRFTSISCTFFDCAYWRYSRAPSGTALSGPSRSPWTMNTDSGFISSGTGKRMMSMPWVPSRRPEKNASVPLVLTTRPCSSPEVLSGAPKLVASLQAPDESLRHIQMS